MPDLDTEIKAMIAIDVDGSGTFTPMNYGYNFDVNDGDPDQILYEGNPGAGELTKRYGKGLIEYWIEAEFEVDWTDATGNWALAQANKNSDVPKAVRYYPRGIPGSGETLPYFEIEALILVRKNQAQRSDKQSFTLRAVPHISASAEPAWGTETIP